MQTDSLAGRAPGWLRTTTIVAAGTCVIAYLYVALSRLTYPFELEWMEGSALLQVTRLINGDPLYVAPSMNYVPMIYPPLYFYLSASVARIIGSGFAALRLVSLLASFGCFALIFVMVRRATTSTFAGILATGLFAASFRVSGAWFDVARIDSLFLFFLLSGLYFLQLDTARSHVLAALAFALAFLTKQTAAIAFVPVLAFCVLRNGRHGAIFLLTAIVAVAVATLYLRHRYGDWYLFYVFELPARHHVALSPRRLLTCVSGDVIAPFATALALIACGFLLDAGRARIELFSIAAIGLVATAVLGRLHACGYTNVLMPACAGIAILCGRAVQQLLALCANLPRSAALSTAIYAACLIQFAALGYDVSAQIPSQSDLANGRRLVRALSHVAGDVYVPHHTYLAVLAGKPIYAHSEAFGDLAGNCGGGDAPAWARVQADILDAVRNRFELVMLDTMPEWLAAEVGAHYEERGPIFNDRFAFWPVTGARLHPQLLYVRKNGPTAAALRSAPADGQKADVLSRLTALSSG